MTPEEEQDIQHIGIVDTTNIITLFTTAFFYGLYFLLFWAAILLLFHGKRLSHLSGTVLTTAAVLCILFLSTTLYVSVFAASVVRLEDIVLVSHPEMSLTERMAAANAGARSQIVIENWPGNINIVFADGILVWRTIRVYGDDKRVHVVTWILLSAVSGICIYNSVRGSIDGTATSQRGAGTVAVNTASFFLSFGLNLVCTLLIGWKAWMHRGIIRGRLGIRRQSVAGRVLLLLVESGTFYLVLQLALGIFSLTDKTTSSHYDRAIRAIGSSFTIISALYPTAIIVIVKAGTSVSTSLSAIEFDTHEMNRRDAGGRNRIDTAPPNLSTISNVSPIEPNLPRFNQPRDLEKSEDKTATSLPSS